MAGRSWTRLAIFSTSVRRYVVAVSAIVMITWGSLWVLDEMVSPKAR